MIEAVAKNTPTSASQLHPPPANSATPSAVAAPAPDGVNAPSRYARSAAAPEMPPPNPRRSPHSTPRVFGGNRVSPRIWGPFNPDTYSQAPSGEIQLSLASSS